MDKMQLAKSLGIYHDGWKMEHYFRDVVANYRWMCMPDWGEKGSFKSNDMLQNGYRAFHGFDEFEQVTDMDGKPIIDEKTGLAITLGKITKWDDMQAWEEVKKSFVFRPQQFNKILTDAIKGDHRVTWVGWDDINIYLPRSMYFTQRRLYETMAKNWEGMRANLNIFECSAPRKDRVVSFILNDMNWSILCSNQRRAYARRWFVEDDYYDAEKVNKYRIDVAEYDIVRDNVPSEVWSWYWNNKKELLDESTQGMIKVLEELDKPPAERKEKITPQEEKEAEAVRAKLFS